MRAERGADGAVRGESGVEYIAKRCVNRGLGGGAANAGIPTVVLASGRQAGGFAVLRSPPGDGRTNANNATADRV